MVPTELPVKDGAVDISGDASLCFVCCANRYGLGSKTIAVYRNFGLLTGALASTISHDSHNLTVCYRSADDAWLAAETLRNCGGGVCAANNGSETHIELPAAGAVSQKPCAEVAQDIAEVQKAVDVISGGCTHTARQCDHRSARSSQRCYHRYGALWTALTQSFVPVFADM